jgi:signal transduction histidine kinase/CheY-like chemotaxis protein
VYEKDGSPSFVICTGIDITERKQAEEEILKLNSELEQRVETRTSELAEANRELRQEVAERRRAQLALEQAKEEAERANNAKDQFLAVLSHELRTPLTPVIATIEVLQDEPTITGDIRELFLSIRRNVELEAQLIDDLLDLTRIAKGKLQLHDDQLDAHALLHNVLEICHPNVGEKKLKVTHGLSAEKHWVRGDAARLQQVFWNLVKNAVKFTPKGGEITVGTANDERGRLVLEVTDTGIGIDDASLAKIFDAFEQASGDITRIFGGLGLGLSICKALVEAHGGEIEAESRGTGLGATFRVTLPTIQEPVRQEPVISGGTISSQSDIRILVVEDHRETNVVIQLFLERQGYTVSSARTVEEARELMRTGHYDLLISDISLPDGNGLDLMRSIRETQPMLGIALSGFGMEQDVKRSLEAGFIEHLVKPVGVRALQAAIERATQTEGLPSANGTGPGRNGI